MEKKSACKFTCIPLRAGRDPGDGISELVELQEFDGYHDAKVGIAYTYKGKVLFEPARDGHVAGDGLGCLLAFDGYQQWRYPQRRVLPHRA